MRITITENQQNNHELEGQLWEPCKCGKEPVYMPSHLCEKCLNKD